MLKKVENPTRMEITRCTETGNNRSMKTNGSNMAQEKLTIIPYNHRLGGIPETTMPKKGKG